jgi:hypothetical protein
MRRTRLLARTVAAVVLVTAVLSILVASNGHVFWVYPAIVLATGLFAGLEHAWDVREERARRRAWRRALE